MQPGTSHSELQLDEYDDVAVFRLIGEHDLGTVGQLRDALAEQIHVGRGVVVSLMEATFIDSSSINALLVADKQLRSNDRRLTLHVATASIVRRVLDMTGICTLLPCSGVLEDALQLARRDPTA